MPTDSTVYRATQSKLSPQRSRNLAAIRMFALWDTAFPDPASTWARTNGRHVLLSVKAQTARGHVRYRDIAAAQPGSPLHATMVRWASDIKSFGAPIHVTFNHEPEAVASDGSGTATEFIAAWRKFVTVLRAQGVRNAEYLFIATAHGFKRTDDRQADHFYPGDAYVDDIGADAYNWYTCRAGVNTAWRPLADIIEPFRLFGAQHPSKGLWLPEFASTEDPARPERKAQWVSEVRALLKQPAYSSFEGVLSFYRSTIRENCDCRIDSSPLALDAYRGLAHDPFYLGTY